MKELVLVLGMFVAPAGPAAAASPAPAATPTPIITIQSCRIFYRVGGILPWGKSMGPVAISFTPETARPLASVTFDVVLDGTHHTVSDEGPFELNARNDHHYRSFSGAQRLIFSREAQPSSCSVTAVKFADGTSLSPGLR